MSDGSDSPATQGPVAMLNTGVDSMKTSGSDNGAVSLNMVGFQFDGPLDPVWDCSEEEHPDDIGTANADDDEISEEQWNQFWTVVLACASRVKSLEVSKKMAKQARANLTKPNPMPSQYQPTSPPLLQCPNLLPRRRWSV